MVWFSLVFFNIRCSVLMIRMVVIKMIIGSLLMIILLGRN